MTPPLSPPSPYWLSFSFLFCVFLCTHVSVCVCLCIHVHTEARVDHGCLRSLSTIFLQTRSLTKPKHNDSTHGTRGLLSKPQRPFCLCLGSSGVQGCDVTPGILFGTEI